MRPTIQFQTPITQKIVVIKEYVTAREKKSFVSIFLNGGISMNAETKDVKGINQDMIAQWETLKLQTVIVSIDGDTNILPLMEELPSKDYEFINQKVEEIVADYKTDEVKKN